MTEKEAKDSVNNWVWDNFPEDTQLEHDLRVEASMMLSKFFFQKMLPEVLEDFRINFIKPNPN